MQDFVYRDTLPPFVWSIPAPSDISMRDAAGGGGGGALGGDYTGFVFLTEEDQSFVWLTPFPANITTSGDPSGFYSLAPKIADTGGSWNHLRESGATLDLSAEITAGGGDPFTTTLVDTHGGLFSISGGVITSNAPIGWRGLQLDSGGGLVSTAFTAKSVAESLAWPAVGHTIQYGQSLPGDTWGLDTSELEPPGTPTLYQGGVLIPNVPANFFGDTITYFLVLLRASNGEIVRWQWVVDVDQPVPILTDGGVTLVFKGTASGISIKTDYPDGTLFVRTILSSLPGPSDGQTLADFVRIGGFGTEIDVEAAVTGQPGPTYTIALPDAANLEHGASYTCYVTQENGDGEFSSVFAITFIGVNAPPVVPPVPPRIDGKDPRDHLPAGWRLTRESHDALVAAWAAADFRPLTTGEIIAVIGEPLPTPRIERSFGTGRHPAETRNSRRQR